MCYSEHVSPPATANSSICFFSAKAKPKHLVFSGSEYCTAWKSFLHTECRIISEYCIAWIISWWEAWGPTASAMAVCGRRNCLSTFPKSEEGLTASIAVLSALLTTEKSLTLQSRRLQGAHLARILRAAELQGHRPLAVPICTGGWTLARLIKKHMGLWQPRDAASAHACIRGQPSF